MSSVISIFYLVNIKRKTKLYNHFSLKVNKVIIIFIILIVAFHISIFLPLSYFVSNLINNNALNSSNNIKYTAILTVLAAIFEEVIFRGIFLDGYFIRYKAKKAIIISAIFFGIIHFNLISPTQFVGAIVLGFFTGYVYYYSRSIGMTILLHLTYNITVFIIGKLSSVNHKTINTLEFYGYYSIYILGISFLILLYTIYYIIKNKEQIINKLKQLDAPRRLPV
jgi:membrane protease YdiL (CAAX protease family)